MPWSPLPIRDGSAGAPPVPVPQLLDQVLAGLGAPSAEAVVVVHERWAEIIGSELVDHAHPLSIEAGRLRIGVDSAAWASHIRWSEAEILGRLDRLVGPGTASSVVVRVLRR